MNADLEEAFRAGWIAGSACSTDAASEDVAADRQHNPFRDPILALWWRWGFSNGQEQCESDVVAT